MEERLNKFKRNFIIKRIFESVLIFLWIYPLAFGIIDEKQWFKAGIAVIAVLLISNLLTRKKIQQRKEETLRIMPMIISIKDTVESLKKERTTYYIIDFVMFVFGFIFFKSGILRLPACISLALSCMFKEFQALTTQKIKYLESRPEGL